jgi:N-acetylglucosaminyldiphosphoundecaprenol N-acetyl-beta-D-mannosaminyltransferase
MPREPVNSPSVPPVMPRQYLLGTPLCLTSYQGFAQHCLHLARQPGTTSVDFTNAQIVTLRRHDPRFREATSRVDYFIPDATPLQWCLNLKGARLPDRVYGPAFMRSFLSQPAPGYTHYLLGGSEHCIQQLEERLKRLNPALEIIGRHHGYFAAADEPAILAEINRLSPDFVWVGLGTPKQQFWIHQHRDELKRGVVLAVGFAFDVNAGTKRDAPRLMQRLGLTWLFRMLAEPRRIGARVVQYNSLFLFYLLWDGLRGRLFAAPESQPPTTC